MKATTAVFIVTVDSLFLLCLSSSPLRRMHPNFSVFPSHSHLHLFGSNLPLAYCLAPPPLAASSCTSETAKCSTRFASCMLSAQRSPPSVDFRAASRTEEKDSRPRRHSHGAHRAPLSISSTSSTLSSSSFPSPSSTLPSISLSFLARPCLLQLLPSAVPPAVAAIHCSAFRYYRTSSSPSTAHPAVPSLLPIAVQLEHHSNGNNVPPLCVRVKIIQLPLSLPLCFSNCYWYLLLSFTAT